MDTQSVGVDEEGGLMATGSDPPWFCGGHAEQRGSVDEIEIANGQSVSLDYSQ